ncbi:hypothetical protein Tco_0196363, partial [Tanacetum coccineum]
PDGLYFVVVFMVRSFVWRRCHKKLLMASNFQDDDVTINFDGIKICRLMNPKLISTGLRSVRAKQRKKKGFHTFLATVDEGEVGKLFGVEFFEGWKPLSPLQLAVEEVMSE